MRSPATGYALAVALPIAITYVVAWLGVPAFVFEHLVVLLVIVVAIPWGRGPAILTVVASVAADNVLLTEPIGRPTITGWRDIVDPGVVRNGGCRGQRTGATSARRADDRGGGRWPRATRP